MPEPPIPTETPGTLADEAVVAFVCFVFSDEAHRPSVRGRRPKLPLQGRHVSYGVKTQRHGSDRSERIYVAVKALQGAGYGNYQACCEVTGRMEAKLGTSRRGRPRRIPRTRELADKVETVRSLYNRFKLRHRWKEKLPERDVVYEQWCERFRLFQQWVAERVLPALNGSVSGQKFAEELALRAGQGGQNNYEALAGLGTDGLTACLNSWRPHGKESPGTSDQAQRFVKEFFSWVESSEQEPKTQSG